MEGEIGIKFKMSLLFIAFLYLKIFPSGKQYVIYNEDTYLIVCFKNIKNIQSTSCDSYLKCLSTSLLILKHIDCILQCVLSKHLQCSINIPYLFLNLYYLF